MTDDLERWAFSAREARGDEAPLVTVMMVPTPDGAWTPYQKAADRIAALEAERDRLREALALMTPEARKEGWHVMSDARGLAYSAGNAALGREPGE